MREGRNKITAFHKKIQFLENCYQMMRATKDANISNNNQFERAINENRDTNIWQNFGENL